MRRAVYLVAWTLAGHVLLASPPVTFNKDIAPVIYSNCSPCHRPGEAGPFSLLTYDDVKKRARQIATVTRSRFMPPWLPEPGPLQFADQRRLTDDQIALIERWVEQGSPQGRPADLPPAPKLTAGWQLGEPDLILKLSKAYTLTAEGPDVYRNFIFTFPLDGTRYVRALEIRPGNTRVVHHANLLIDRTRSSRWKDGRDGQPGFPGMDLKIEANIGDPESHFLFWKPGSVLTQEPDGMAWQIEQGTDLVFNMHLQPSGKPELIEPSLGLYFTSEAPHLHPLLVQLENDRALDIPPGAANFKVEDDFTLPVDVDVLGIYPHAHYLGTDVAATATLPDGSSVPLIHIPHWNLNWQSVFRYRKPVFLPKGTRLSMRWTYDNSTANPANPSHPPRRVTAGDQATDEMAHVWLQLLPRGPDDQRMVIQEAMMRKRIARDPGDFTAHFNLGGVLQAKNDAAGAIRELREAIRIRPSDEVALNTLGAFLQMQGALGEAEGLYRQAIAVRPEYADAHYNLASLLLARGDFDGAIPQLRGMVKLKADDAKARQMLVDALGERSKRLRHSGRLPEATADLREIVDLAPGDSGALTNLGVALAIQGQLNDAENLFERAVLLDPSSDAAKNNLDRVKQMLAHKR